MRPDLLEKYDLRVPRYTSYPTAPHFSETVDADVYGNWLRDLDPADPLSLYFHIPFCDSMCWFCGCYTKIVKRYEPVRDYLDVLLKEIDLMAEALPGTFKARHLHWGGGSPTMLKGGDWLEIITHLRKRFDVIDNAEVAVELDPRTATEDYVRALAEAGVNRTSIGVQDFDPKVQEAINRIQPHDVTKRVVDWLRQYGIDKVNMDLMYGLPHQTTDLVIKEVDLAVEMRPVRVALFGYAHVPWMKSHQKMIKEEDLPDTPERWEQFTAASERLEAAGYVKIGLDHFALPEDELAIALDEGRLHRNFQGYTTDAASTMIGMGASSIGQLPQGYVQNALPLRDYRKAIEEGRFAVAKGLELSDEDRLNAAVIERIMCDMSVDLDAIAGHFGVSEAYFDADLDKLVPLAEDGICSIEERKVAVGEDGRPFIRLVAAVFDRYLDRGQKRHSKAV